MDGSEAVLVVAIGPSWFCCSLLRLLLAAREKSQRIVGFFNYLHSKQRLPEAEFNFVCVCVCVCVRVNEKKKHRELQQVRELREKENLA